MTYDEFVRKVSEKANITMTDFRKIMDAMFDVTCDSVKNKENVRLGKFGNIKVKEVSERTRTIPYTDKKVTTPAHSDVEMKLSSMIRDVLRKEK